MVQADRSQGAWYRKVVIWWKYGDDEKTSKKGNTIDDKLISIDRSKLNLFISLLWSRFYIFVDLCRIYPFQIHDIKIQIKMVISA